MRWAGIVICIVKVVKKYNDKREDDDLLSKRLGIIPRRAPILIELPTLTGPNY